MDGRKVISYGTSSYGYDIRCARVQGIHQHPQHRGRPQNFDEKSFVDSNDDVCIIPAQQLRLAAPSSTSAFRATCSPSAWAKSTYARCGIIVNVTPFEPEWEGYVTLEFSNTTPLPAKIYAGEGCAQVLFFESDKDDVCETSYKDRGGSFQGQHSVTLPKARFHEFPRSGDNAGLPVVRAFPLSDR